MPEGGQRHYGSTVEHMQATHIGIGLFESRSSPLSSQLSALGSSRRTWRSGGFSGEGCGASFRTREGGVTLVTLIAWVAWTCELAGEVKRVVTEMTCVPGSDSTAESDAVKQKCCQKLANDG